MIEDFMNQEAAYEAYVAAQPSYICNDFGARERRIHRSSCNMLHRAGQTPTGAHTSVRKVCSTDLNELMDWLVARYGSPGSETYSFCQFCFRPA
jgi:hypothetical protein